MKLKFTILFAFIISFTLFIPISFTYAVDITTLPVTTAKNDYEQDYINQLISLALTNGLDWLVTINDFSSSNRVYRVYLYGSNTSATEPLHLTTNNNAISISNDDGLGISAHYYTFGILSNPKPAPFLTQIVNQQYTIGYTDTGISSYFYIVSSSKPIYGLDYVSPTDKGGFVYANYTTAVNKTISLPPGYAISFKQIPDIYIADNSFILKETLPLGIPAFITTWDNGTYYKYTDGFLTPEYSKNMLTFDTINYDIDRSLFKVNFISSHFTFNSSLDTINFFNPVMYSIGPTNKAQNGTKTIVYPANSYSVKLYNIVTSDKYGFILEGYEESEYQYNDDDPDDYQSNPYFTDPDGNPITPPDGGSLNNEEPGKYTQESAIDKIKQVIDNFKNTLINLFSAPTSAITSLIDAGGSFMGVVAGMFAWLPSPVAVVIQSGLILLVVIGVLKMLL